MHLDDLKLLAASCTGCELSNGRVMPVFSKGASTSKFMLCGMCPGPDENKLANTEGKPFVGRAGKLLDLLLEDLGIALDDIYVTNIVKCYVKPGITLEKHWCDCCLPYIINEIDVVQPNVIVTLGGDATNALMGFDPPMKIGALRGRVSSYTKDIMVIHTYHPSYVLRSGGKGSHGYNKMLDDLTLALEIVKERKSYYI